MSTIIAASLIVLIGGLCMALTVRIERASKPAVASTGSAEPDLKREPENAVERLVVALKRRHAARISLSVLSIGLLGAAAAVIGYPFYTNLYQQRLQGQLDKQLESQELRDAYLNRSVGVGDALTRITIPDIGVDVVVVEGTTASALRAGAGHYPSTPLPCEDGNVAIAGHRTTYGRPFHDVDLLEPGNPITLETPIGECTYEVSDTFIVTPDQVEVVDNTPGEAILTLTSCHPKGSLRERIIIRAEMVDSSVADETGPEQEAAARPSPG